MSGQRLAMVLLLVVLSTGCWDQRIVDQIDYAVNVGVDARPNGGISMSVTAPALQADQPRPVLYATVADTLREARERLRRQSNGRLEAGKMEQVFFGETLARRGILDYLDVIIRDPFNPILARVVVVKGSAKGFLQQAIKWKSLLLPGLYLGKLLDQAASIGDISPGGINHFLTGYYAPGVDPLPPMIEATEERANILGSALFRDDKMVGELNVDETFLVTVLRGRATMHNQALPLPRGLARGKRKMIMRFNRGKAKLEIELGAGVPRVVYDIKFDALLEDFHLGFPITDKVLKEVETAAAGALRRRFEAVWEKLRRANSDPIGLGNQVRAKHNAYWLRHDWREVFPKINAAFRVKVNVQNYGVMR
ncbi:MAG: Ger(x)C family spore germination protein [Bacteroidota bacterium]